MRVMCRVGVVSISEPHPWRMAQTWVIQSACRVLARTGENDRMRFWTTTKTNRRLEGSPQPPPGPEALLEDEVDVAVRADVGALVEDDDAELVRPGWQSREAHAVGLGQRQAVLLLQRDGLRLGRRDDLVARTQLRL